MNQPLKELITYKLSYECDIRNYTGGSLRVLHETVCIYPSIVCNFLQYL